ncbi:MAG: hypothetical protein M3Q24_02700 [bacterium]|nr:hypothetical protein [bacterium]
MILIGAKIWEEKNRKSFFLLRGISRGDERFKVFSQNAAHAYADIKENGLFFINKQLPLHTKSFLNKSSTLLKENGQKHLDKMRSKGYLRKSGSISEYFKNNSDKNKDKEEIVENRENDYEDSQNHIDQVK